jgi:hypothetical protein
MLFAVFIPISDTSLKADPTHRVLYFLLRGFRMSGNLLTQNNIKKISIRETEHMDLRKELM